MTKCFNCHGTETIAQIFEHRHVIICVGCMQPFIPHDAPGYPAKILALETRIETLEAKLQAAIETQYGLMGKDYLAADAVKKALE